MVCVEDLELPALTLGVALVHAEQVAGEQVRLLTAFGPADLHDHVSTFVGVFGQEEQLDLGGEALHVGVGLRGFLAHSLAVVAAQLGHHLPGGGGIVGAATQYHRTGHDGLQLLVPAGQLPVERRAVPRQ